MNGPRLFGIYLAAGKSSRMGCNKLYLPIGKTTIGSRSLIAALESNLDGIIVVVRRKDSLAWMDDVLFSDKYKHKWTPIICDEAEKGQSFSIKCGLEEAVNLGADGVVILLADQPLIETRMIDQLLVCYQTNPRSTRFIASKYDGKTQPPILFTDLFFPVLRQIKGDEGARAVLRRQDTGQIINYEDGRGFYDVDTEEDYKWVRKLTNY
ncbi:NTP transferase domain-containing protein [Sediminibacillus massiliensis]|uniref:NTP transferase domain-containing protein n=1 Tax=Sediminibacillus massiliensis TaxID=1926277 RepID=UPI0015C3CD12|nr:NTP transferase domain-containing protein [Sediminibacillus massiliensis]